LRRGEERGEDGEEDGRPLLALYEIIILNY